MLTVKIIEFLLSCALLLYLAKYLVSVGQHEADFVASLLASILAALSLAVLFCVEQRKASGLSDPTTLYLVASILCDIVIASNRSSTLAGSENLRPVQFRCLAHFLTFFLEIHSRRSAFAILNDHGCPDETNGVLSRVFFTWINPILLQGYRNILIDQNLPCLSEDMNPEVTREELLKTWSQRG